jgi:hypothetical protein
LSVSQNFLCAMTFSDRSISAYSIGNNGAPTQVPGSPFILPDTPGDIAAIGDDFLGDDFLYVTLPTSNSILGFTIAANGVLVPPRGLALQCRGAVLLTTVQIPPP